jgi:hypothetical protein
MNNYQALDHVFRFAPSDLTLVQRLLLLQIAYHQPKCYQRVSTLAKSIGVRQEETVRAALKQLVERGLVAVQSRKGRTNVYRVLVSNTPPVEHDPYGETGGHPSRQTGGHPLEQTGVKHIKKQISLTEKDFEIFWSIYPRKESRKKAFDQFMLTPNVSIDTLLAATRTYRDAVSGREMKFVSMAHNWLANEAWLDQIDSSSSSWMDDAIDD